MIQPNELRLGNWVKRNEYNAKIIALNVGGLVAEREDGARYFGAIHAFVPIPLTEELIEKQGWEKVCYYYTDKNGLEIYETNDGWHLHIDDDKCQTTIAILINSVHELQNAYFVATKKELEIKL